jgi:hypothetical protein
MPKTTVLKDGPGTVLDRRARMHDALDRALDRRAAARDEDPSTLSFEELKEAIKSIVSSQQVGPRAKALRAELQRRLNAGEGHDEYRFAKPPAKPRPLMSVTNKEDLAKMAAKGGSELHKAKASDTVSTVWKRGMRVVNKATGEKGSYASNIGGGKAAVEPDSKKGDLAYWRFDDIEPARKKASDAGFAPGDKVWANPIGKSGGTVRGTVARINASGQVVVESGGREHEFHPANVRKSTDAGLKAALRDVVKAVQTEADGPWATAKNEVAKALGVTGQEAHRLLLDAPGRTWADKTKAAIAGVRP